MLFRSLVSALILVTCVYSARILSIFHIQAHSHQLLGVRLLQALAEQGHEITFVTSLLPKTPIKNAKIVEIEIPRKYKQEVNLFELFDVGDFIPPFMYDAMGVWITEAVLNNTSVQNLLKSDARFDLIIMEQFLNEAFRGFCYHYKAPCVLMSTIGSNRWTNAQMGNPAPLSYVPEMLLSMSSNMTFFQRMYNTLVYTASELFTHLYTFRKHEQLLHQYFPGAPPLYDLYYNTSLMLLNSHVSVNAPVPHVPNMIEIGGFHLVPPKELPQDLQEYLDNAREGVVYFSMGSHLKSKDLPKPKLNDVLYSLSKLKQKVLWKWEDDDLPNRPKNVNISSWFPQQDLLAHPNIKLFITHGGLLSTFEAIYHGIPLVGIPIFGDQRMNMANSEHAGFAKSVPYRTLTEETLSNALREVLENPKYARNAKTRSKVLHDQPIKPLDNAVYWVEYVLRHRGAPHLRTAAVNLAWYQYFLLDVIAFSLFVLFLTLFILYKLIRAVCCKKRTSTSITESKKVD